MLMYVCIRIDNTILFNGHWLFTPSVKTNCIMNSTHRILVLAIQQKLSWSTSRHQDDELQTIIMIATKYAPSSLICESHNRMKKSA